MDEIYKVVMYDLDILDELSKKIVAKMPPVGSMVKYELYLQNTSIQILIISQLEYFLKKNKIIKEREQHKIIEVIEKSSLKQLEKDHLYYLFFVRHTLIHNAGNYDSKFFENIRTHIKELKLKGVEKGLPSPIDPELLSMNIELVKKLINELGRNLM